MWLYFNNKGQLLEILEHGTSARAGTTSFEIFAFFEGIYISGATSYPDATIKLRKPDLTRSEYPLLLMQSSITKTFTLAAGESATKFQNNTSYTGYYFNFADFNDEQDTEILLDTPGLWEAIITLVSSTDRSLNTQGVATFNVANGSTTGDVTEMSIDYVLIPVYTQLNNKLNKDGTNSPTADISWNSHKITNLATPTLGGDATNKAYVDLRALDTSVVHKTGSMTEVVNGVKSFVNGIKSDTIDAYTTDATITFGNDLFVNGDIETNDGVIADSVTATDITGTNIIGTSKVKTDTIEPNTNGSNGTVSLSGSVSVSGNISGTEIIASSVVKTDNVIGSSSQSYNRIVTNSTDLALGSPSKDTLVLGTTAGLYGSSAAGISAPQIVFGINNKSLTFPQISGTSDTVMYQSDILDNLTSTVTNKTVSARVVKELADEIANLKAKGRFLAVWDCTTGLPETYPIPTEYPFTYTYKTGDYFIIGTVGTTNKKPSGSSITKASASASWVIGSTDESNEVKANDYYIYDGTNGWTLVSSTVRTYTWSEIANKPTSISGFGITDAYTKTEVDSLIATITEVGY